MNDPVLTALAQARRALLDLSTRNRLLSLPKAGRSAGVIVLADEDATFVLDRLLDGKDFSFEAAEGEADADSRKDTKLRAALAEKDLPKRLLSLSRDARTALEETGINTLSLAIGALVWRDPGTPATERRAPLALLRVALARGSVRSGFRLSAEGEEAEDNLSLREKLSTEFGIRLPAFDPAAYSPAAWAEAVRGAIAAQPEWRVEQDALHLGLFSFAKFLMHADLDPAENTHLPAHPMVRALLGNEALSVPPAPPDDSDLDELIPAARLDFVMDADGSQTLATHAVRQGGHLVIQGPPGTGKSQTITNVIAQAVLDGRTVLFVAEKLAALQVVKRRLDQVGLGDACLELHSDRLSKRAVIDALRATFSAGPRRAPDRAPVVERLATLRSRLNRQSAAMNRPIGTTGRTPHQAVGQLVRLRLAGVKPPAFRLDDAAGWTAEQLAERRRAVRDAVAAAQRIGVPAHSAWRGVAADLSAPDLDRALADLPEKIAALSAAASAWGQGAGDPAALSATPERARALADAAATVAEPGGMLGFLSSSRRAARAMVDGATAEGKALFGAAWPADVARLRACADWAGTHGAACAAAHVFLRERFGMAAGAEPLASLPQRLAALIADPAGYAPWTAWRRAAEAARAQGLTPLVEAVESGALPAEEAAPAFAYAAAEALLAAARRERPELATFDGNAQRQLLDDFSTTDKARIELARTEAACAHAERLRAARAAPGADVLRGEMERRRGFLPVRDLLERAGPAVRLAKPVLMMSPLTVAQFLKPGAEKFDLMVIDEASQIEPVDALGAIARARQCVVVGDDRQMPPTRFFQRLTGEEHDTEEDAEATVQAGDVESILGLCNARGVPSAMLRWHYRSRHESLIATSNEQFYERRLLLLPSPRPRGPDLGLGYVRVEGSFDTGATGTNKAEAEAVAQAVMDHAKTTPKLSLGVAAFSIRQRDAIADAVEALRRKSADTEPFFATASEEPFFVKNLENVQGDERDVIMISVGYGRDKDGKVAMRFGPLSADGGERRLNVLITRAKRRCVVFTNLSADDIDTDRASGRGVAALRTFLRFAAAADTLSPPATDGGEQAPLEAAIADALAADGIATVPRVGASGVFVDLAVAKPDDARTFRLGIETDGPSLAAAASARDRDRLRGAALGGMGWTLLRTHALDWLDRPEAERARLRAALGVASDTAPEVAAPADQAGLAAPYVEAAFEVDRATRPEALPFARLGSLVARIVQAEGPVHQDAIVERARILWGQDAADAKLRAAIQQALRLGAELNGLVAEDAFWRAEDSVVVPRDRRAVAAHLRTPALLPPAELRAAILALLGTTTGATEAEIAAGTARMLGVGDDAKPAIAAQLALLRGEGKIEAADASGQLLRSALAPSPPDRGRGSTGSQRA